VIPRLTARSLGCIRTAVTQPATAWHDSLARIVITHRRSRERSRVVTRIARHRRRYVVTRLASGPYSMAAGTGTGNCTGVVIVSGQPRGCAVMTLVALIGRGNVARWFAGRGFAMTRITGTRSDS